MDLFSSRVELNKDVTVWMLSLGQVAKMVEDDKTKDTAKCHS